jgi:hypothetical protein
MELVMKKSDKTWLKTWSTEEYKKHKIKTFNLIDNYIQSIPNKILDIGCGWAFESEMFQKKYDSDLYLLDGDYHKNKKDQIRHGFWGPSEDMKFYTNVNYLINSFKERNLRYKFLDVNQLELNEKTVFDLIYSFLSCGFHYPAKTYKNFILNYSDENSIIIMDIWKESLNEQLNDFEIIQIIDEGINNYTIHLKFKS